MTDSSGEMYMNPGYANYMNSHSSRIDWMNVGLDIGSIAGGGYGGIAVGELRIAIGAGIVAFSQLSRLMRDAVKKAQEDDDHAQETPP